MMTRSGSPISVRHIVSICCSPPESTPAGLSWRSPRLGNSANTSSNFQRPNTPARFRHIADAEMGDLIGPEPGDGAALERDIADRRHQPHDGLARSRTADAVAPK